MFLISVYSPATKAASDNINTFHWFRATFRARRIEANQTSLIRTITQFIRPQSNWMSLGDNSFCLEQSCLPLLPLGKLVTHSPLNVK